MSEPSTTPSLPLSNHCDSIVRHYFPDLAELVDDFRGSTLRAKVSAFEDSENAQYIPRESNSRYSASPGGALDTTRARYKWIIANDVITVKVKPLEVPEGHERSALLRENRRGLTRLVIRDTLIQKEFVESRKSHGRIESTLSHLASDGTHPLIECTGDPFLLTSNQADASAQVTEGLELEGLELGLAMLGLEGLRLEGLELEEDYAIEPVESSFAPTYTRSPGFRSTRNCTRVLLDHFGPFLPYLRALKDKTIREYLQDLEADSRNTVSVQPPDPSGLRMTLVTTLDANIVVSENTSLRELKITLNSGVGRIELKEGEMNRLLVVNEQEHLTIFENQSETGVVARQVYIPGTLSDVWDLTGETIHFPMSARRLRGPPEASTAPGSTHSPARTTNDGHGAQAQSSARTGRRAHGSSRGHLRRGNAARDPSCRTH